MPKEENLDAKASGLPDVHIDPSGGSSKELHGDEKYLCGEAISWKTRHSNRLSLVTCERCKELRISS